MRILSLLFIVFISILSPGCDRCGETPDNYYYVKDSTKARSPYVGAEELTFLKNGGDTLRFRGQGFVQDFWQKLRLGGDCFEERQFLEINNLTFMGDNDSIVYWLYMIGPVSDNIGIFYKDYYFEECPCAIRAPYDFDSLRINDKWYYGIRKIVRPRSDGDTSNYVLFNKEQGILKIKAGVDVLTIL